jgi:hypothetical protein
LASSVSSCDAVCGDAVDGIKERYWEVWDTVDRAGDAFGEAGLGRGLPEEGARCCCLDGTLAEGGCATADCKGVGFGREGRSSSMTGTVKQHQTVLCFGFGLRFGGLDPSTAPPCEGFSEIPVC